MFKLIDRYIGKTIFLSIALVVIVLLGLDLLFAFIDELGDVQGEYTVTRALWHVMMTTPRRLYDLVTVSTLIGCLIGLGALASNSELVVMRAAGVSIFEIVFSTLQPVLLILLGALTIGQFIVPITEPAAQSYRALYQGGGQVMKIKQGNWHREGNDFIHINAIEPNGVMHGVTRYHFDENLEMVSTSFARRAIYRGDTWFVQDKRITEFKDDKVVTRTLKSSEWDSQLTPKLLNLVVMEPDYLSITELYFYSHYLNSQGLNAKPYRLSFWQKVFQPLVTIVMVLIAVSFVFGPLRSVTVGLRVMVGLVVGLLFIYAQEFTGQVSLVYQVPTVVGAFVPILLFALFGVLLLRRV